MRRLPLAREPQDETTTSLSPEEACLPKRTITDEFLQLSINLRKGPLPEYHYPEAKSPRSAVVHLNCDLYEPMKASLEFFYRTVDGRPTRDARELH